MSNGITYCFVDANVFMHFQSFDEVDWVGVLNADQVCLMLAPSVMEELNQYKDDRTNERRRTRVRTILSKFKKLLSHADSDDTVDIRPSVSLMFVATEPMVNWSDLKLDRQQGDDRLLASILEFIETHPDGLVQLVTNDFPAQLKAKSKGIRVFDPEDQIPLLELSSPEAARIKELEQKLRAFENQVPKLELFFWKDTNRVKHLTQDITSPQPTELSLHTIDLRVAKQRRKLEQMLVTASSADKEDIEQFAEDCKRHLTLFRQALEAQYLKAAGTRCVIPLVLCNTSSAPATDVELRLSFPKGIFIVGISDETDVIWGLEDELPNEPTPAWTQSVSWRSNLWSGPFIHPSGSIPSPIPSGPRGPLYNKKQRNNVHYKHSKLRPTAQWHMESLIAFIPPEIQGGFHIEYNMQADKLPAPLQGQLHVVLRHKDTENE